MERVEDGSGMWRVCGKALALSLPPGYNWERKLRTEAGKELG